MRTKVNATTKHPNNGVNNSEKELISKDIESPGPLGTYEAHHGEEKEKYKTQTGQRMVAEIAGQAAQAEDVIDENQRQDGRSLLLRACLCFCFCLMLVLVVTITTGIVVSRKAASKGSNEIGIVSPLKQEPSGQPSLMPTTEPLNNAGQPSLMPTSVPPNNAGPPSLMPTSVPLNNAGPPSLMPTSVPLNNAYCEQPHQLVVGQSVSGSFDNAIISTVVNCQYQTQFSSSAFSSPGRWYWYRGEGFPVSVRGDEFVEVHVHLTCSDSSCPLGIIYPNIDGVNHIARWDATQGTDYLILVSVPIETEEEARNFTVTIERNDSEENAFGPLTPGLYTLVGGSTVGAKVASDIPACGSASAPTGPGVWYSVVGNGKTITASTCGSPTGIDTQISVFSAENICVDGNDDFCNGKSQVAWLSTADEMYFVLVHGKGGTQGLFNLQVTTGTEAADADYCSNSVLMDVGSTIKLDLSQATPDPEGAHCIGTSVNGNLYAFHGTGTPVLPVLSTISPLEDLPFYIELGAEILTGSSCSMLECMKDCSFGCQVPTTLGQIYYVYVFYFANTLTATERNMLNGLISLTLESGDASDFVG